MSDIVDRLRDGAPGCMTQGANEILRLRAENEKLRAALKHIAATYNKPTTSKDGLAFAAAAALKETGDD